MKAITIGLATGEIGRRSGVGLCGFDYLGSQPQILMPVQTHRPISEAVPQLCQFFWSVMFGMLLDAFNK